MKFLKNSIIYAASAAMLLSGTACSDFLDKAPENKVPDQGVDYTNLANMYQPVSGVYAQVRGALHFITLGALIVRDDDMWSGRHDDQADLVPMGEKFIYTDSWWGFNESWNQHYAIVRYANSALQDLEAFRANITSQADMERYETYKGEVCFLRAYAYYRLTQLFGDVTILRDNFQSDLQRSTRDAVYRYMLDEDLKYAMEHLPEVAPKDAEHPGAVTAYTAAALAAKVNYQMGNYAEVKRLTDYIINSGKIQLFEQGNDYTAYKAHKDEADAAQKYLPAFYNLFKTAGILCSESLFEVQSTNFGVGSGDEIAPGQWFIFQGPANPGVISGWGFVGYRDQFVDWAEQRGETVRAATTFLKGGETTWSGDFVKGNEPSSTSTNCWNGKAYLPESETIEGRGYGSGNSVRVFRYADVLLMNAEANIRLGSNENFDKTYYAVRKRAGFVDDNVAVAPTLEQVLDERRMELAGEWGERYADLVRTGEAATVLNEGADPDESDSYIITNGWSPDKTYYPIPSTQIENAPDLAKEPKNE